MTNTPVENPIPEGQVKLPFNGYKVRCMKCERKISSKGFPMLMQEVEIMDSKPFTQEGVSIDPNGISWTEIVSLQVKMLQFINRNRVSFGLPLIKESDIPSINPDDYIGQMAPVIAFSKSEEQKNEATGEPILHPLTNKPVIKWNKKVNDWLPRE